MRTSHTLGTSTAVLALTALTALSIAPGASAADGEGVDVVNTETVQVYVNPDGEIASQRVYEQLTLTGNGPVELSNPIEQDGLRNLDGFSGLSVEDGVQDVNLDVDGSAQLRSVSDYSGDLPLDISIEYRLDGRLIDPSDVVGADGRLEVLYTVKNITAQPQEVTFPDGHGGETTETVDVPIPIVGSLSTVAPANFTDVQSDQANMAGDGKGGTKMSFTMTLFPPIGSDTAEFGYTATVSDAVVPSSSVSALPVNPLEVPTFKSAGDSYQAGSDTGVQLAEGATTIDTNVLKLRDGAAKLLAGLLKLSDGADQLTAGLAGEAAPGAQKLADGAGELNAGLGKIDDGAGQLADGAGRAGAGGQELAAGAGDLRDGLGQIDDGAGDLAAGVKRLSGGTGDALSGSQKLERGLKQISGGLDQLAANGGLPAAAEGIKQLQAGVELLLAGLGDTTQPKTLIGGLHALEIGLGRAEAGAGQLGGGMDLLRGSAGDPSNPLDGDGLAKAKNAVDLIKMGLDSALAPANGVGTPGGDLAELKAGIQSLTQYCDDSGDPVAQATCEGTVAALAGGVDTSRGKLTEAAGGLGLVSTGLNDAIGTLTPLSPELCSALAAAGTPTLRCGLAALAAGITEAKTGAGDLKQGAIDLKDGVVQIDGGLDKLSTGVAKAVAGVLALSSGASDAYAGSGDLTDGLGLIDGGARELADGAGRLSVGTGDALDGSGRLAAGADELSSGLDDLADGAGQLADGTGDASDGSERLADGAGELADGLGDAADGSGRLADGLAKAADGAPQLVDGAGRLSDEGMSQLIGAGEDTAQNYGKLYATIEAGAERADAEMMAYGAPEGAQGLTAYSYELLGDDGETGRNTKRGLAALALLGVGGGAFLLRRRLV